MAFQSRTLWPWKAIVQIDLLRFDAISPGAARANSCHYGSNPKVTMTENHSKNSVFRILDAAINRAGEGIRVVEDYLRMVIADAHLALQLNSHIQNLAHQSQIIMNHISALVPDDHLYAVMACKSDRYFDHAIPRDDERKYHALHLHQISV